MVPPFACHGGIENFAGMFVVDQVFGMVLATKFASNAVGVIPRALRRTADHTDL